MGRGSGLLKAAQLGECENPGLLLAGSAHTPRSKATTVRPSEPPSFFLRLSSCSLWRTLLIVISRSQASAQTQHLFQGAGGLAPQATDNGHNLYCCCFESRI